MNTTTSRRAARALCWLLAVIVAACGSTVQHDGISAGRDASLTPGATVDSAGASDQTRGPEGEFNGGSSAASSPGGGASSVASAMGTETASGHVASIPPKGQGWDEKFVYVGITISTDAEKTLGAIGSSLATGDQKGDAEAIVAALNREGGLFGRQIKLLVHDSALARTEADPEGVGQEICSDLTQDRPVIAIVNLTPIASDALWACAAKARTVLISVGSADWDDELSGRYTPYFYSAGFPSLSRLVPVFISRLSEQQYFQRWDTSIGGPSPAAPPVKVGVLYGNTETGRRQGKILATAITKAGYPTETFEYAGENDYPAAVLRFKTNGVTHVTGPDDGMAFFVLAAKSQRYYPRLGIHSYMTPHTSLQEIAGATREQLNGAVGVGWYQYLDVSTAQDAGLSSGGKWCVDALAQGGQTFANNDEHRFAEAFGLGICDGIRLPSRGAQAGGGLDPVAIRKGIVSIGRGYPPAAAGFGVSGLSETNFGFPGAARDLRYDSSCDCFAYVGGTYGL